VPRLVHFNALPRVGEVIQWGLSKVVVKSVVYLPVGQDPEGADAELLVVQRLPVQ
jgi:hypothetical protein